MTVETPEGPVEATVSVLVATTSVDPTRRWRVLCRCDDGEPLATPFYCGDDGVGTLLRPAASPGREVGSAM